MSIREIWRWLRTASGDDAYERYLEHRSRQHPGEPVLGRQEFYAQSQERKWSGVSRCC